MDKRYKVLIVDDSSVVLEGLSMILKDDYLIEKAINGEGAITLAIKTKPDLILLDVIMPGMSGFDVCKILKDNYITKNIPIIFNTSRDEVVDQNKGFELGAVDYISKQTNPTIVKARVKTHLSLSNQRRELNEQVIIRTKELEDTRKEIIEILGRASEYKDNETGLHVKRVMEYSYLLSKAMGIEETEARLIGDASSMHDIGKIGIPDYILKKPERLSVDERDIIKTQSILGAMIFGEQKSKLLKTATIMSLQHHEKVDGTGYPLGLKGDEISLPAKIVALTDVFDALTSERPYKEAWSFDSALDYICSEMDKQFDKEVVDSFMNIKMDILEVYNKYR